MVRIRRIATVAAGIVGLAAIANSCGPSVSNPFDNDAVKDSNTLFYRVNSGLMTPEMASTLGNITGASVPVNGYSHLVVSDSQNKLFIYRVPNQPPQETELTEKQTNQSIDYLLRNAVGGVTIGLDYVGMNNMENDGKGCIDLKKCDTDLYQLAEILAGQQKGQFYKTTLVMQKPDDHNKDSDIRGVESTPATTSLVYDLLSGAGEINFWKPDSANNRIVTIVTGPHVIDVVVQYTDRNDPENGKEVPQNRFPQVRAHADMTRRIEDVLSSYR